METKKYKELTQMAKDVLIMCHKQPVKEVSKILANNKCRKELEDFFGKPLNKSLDALSFAIAMYNDF